MLPERNAFEFTVVPPRREADFLGKKASEKNGKAMLAKSLLTLKKQNNASRISNKNMQIVKYDG